MKFLVYHSIGTSIFLYFPVKIVYLCEVIFRALRRNAQLQWMLVGSSGVHDELLVIFKLLP